MAAVATETQVERYEYKFVRLGEYRGSSLFGVRGEDRNTYEQVVHEHAREGWRLVQIFAPGIAAFGAARYYELIFERPRPEETAVRNAIDEQSAAILEATSSSAVVRSGGGYPTERQTA